MQTSIHLDMDGTLTAAGQRLSGRATDIIGAANEAFGGAVSCNTAQAHKYLLDAGGDVFRCCVNELGLRVQHLDGSIELVQPPDFAAELEAIKAYIESFPTHNLLLIEKNGGFAVKHADIDGRPAKGSHVDRVNSFVRDLALRNRELTFVVTDGFIDLCSAQLSKRFGAELQMRREPFLGTWAIGFGDGLTDERLFEIMNLGVKVGNEPSRADERLTSHVHVLDVLQWMVDLRVEANRLL